jgi:hypothetical protein
MHQTEANYLNRRTYGENAGEDIREGFEPTDGADVVDPKEDDEGTFRVGDEEDEDDDGDEDEGHKGHSSEESRQWAQAREADSTQQPKYGVAGAEFENIWGGEGSGGGGG